MTVPAHSLKVGDILVSSWGYDQTNIDFYLVIASNPSTVKIRQLAQRTTEDGFMCGQTVPILGQFKEDSKVMLKRPRVYEWRGEWHSSVKIEDFASASKWDGNPCRCSWYA